MDTIIDSRYRLIRQIGAGSTGKVFIAEDGLVKRIVAIKLYSKNDTASLRYFDSEARAVSMLSHPNIVEVYDIVSTEKYKYIVMEYIDGVTLRDYVDMHGALMPREAVSCLSQILYALDEAHKNGIVHRDIKPENIMIDKSGRVKLTDFGIAKTHGFDSFRSNRKGVGSVYYISPEQAKGLAVDSRSDIYSLGVVLYTVLSGQVPFDSDTPEGVAMMHITDMPTPLCDINPEIPEGLEKVAMKAMSKDAGARYKDARSMLSALMGAVGGSRVEKEKNEKKRKNTLLPTLAICGACVAAVVLFSILLLRKGETPAYTPITDTAVHFDLTERYDNNIEGIFYGEN